MHPMMQAAVIIAGIILTHISYQRIAQQRRDRRATQRINAIKREWN